MRGPVFGLRRRILVAFLGTVAAVCLLFSLAALMFAYVAEDRMFADVMAEEIRLQQEHWRSQGALTRPRRDYVEFYRDPSRFPADLKTQYRGSSSGGEFAGDGGRHYHVRRFELPGEGAGAFAVVEASRQLVVRPLWPHFLTFLLLSTLAVMFVSGLIAYFLARQAVAPLSRLAERVAGIGAQQIPDLKVDEYPANEIGVLAGALAGAFSRIRSFVAREARFTRDASHELRTPLAIIRSSAELMSQHPVLAAELAPPLRRLEAAALDMEETMELLLALAREENSPSQKEIRPLLPFVETAVLHASQRFGHDSAHLVIDVPASRKVAANPTILTMILTNIVDNAFQHAHGSDVTIRSDGSRLTVADSGPGMAAEAIEGLFTAFAKGGSSDGHGLGLSIVQRLCNREGIGLEVATSGSTGTTVTLDLGDEPAAKRG
jgi:signal transduction histidine kinase